MMRANVLVRLVAPRWGLMLIWTRNPGRWPGLACHAPTPARKKRIERSLFIVCRLNNDSNSLLLAYLLTNWNAKTSASFMEMRIRTTLPASELTLLPDFQATRRSISLPICVTLSSMEKPGMGYIEQDVAPDVQGASRSTARGCA